MTNNQKNKTARKRIFTFITAIMLALVMILCSACDFKSFFKPSEKPSTDQTTTNPPSDGENKDPNGDNKDPNGENKDPDGENKDPNGEDKDPDGEDKDPDGEEKDEPSELEIHFLELGNKYAGDCTLIKVGDTEVLIDAGSKKGSAATIVPYIRQYCTDGVLEYVIATHAHEDHISAFVGTTTAKGIFDSFECGIIIDYALQNTTSQISKDYAAKRDAEVEAGAKHYTALECVNETNGAQTTYELAEGVSMTILYQKFYETKSSDENNYSVCILLTQGEYNYLFTGDLEEAGEASLVESNPDLPHCKLFKGGHHGSRTSSNEILLSKITPDVVCICCCAGSPEYSVNADAIFPTQEMINRVAKYTKQIYVTSLATNVVLKDKSGTWDYTSMNGNIVVWSDGKDLTVTGSNNSTILKETAWFKENRTWPEYGVE